MYLNVCYYNVYILFTTRKTCTQTNGMATFEKGTKINDEIKNEKLEFINASHYMEVQFYHYESILYFCISCFCNVCNERKFQMK